MEALLTCATPLRATSNGLQPLLQPGSLAVVNVEASLTCDSLAVNVPH